MIAGAVVPTDTVAESMVTTSSVSPKVVESTATRYRPTGMEVTCTTPFASVVSKTCTCWSLRADGVAALRQDEPHARDRYIGAGSERLVPVPVEVHLRTERALPLDGEDLLRVRLAAGEGEEGENGEW